MSLIKVKTALALGLPNLARVFAYQLGVKTGLNPVKKINALLKTGEFFSADFSMAPTLKANSYWIENHYYFGQATELTGIPNWHKNFLTGASTNSNKPWFLLSDFNDQLGDIKGVWEASRFDWVVSFAQNAKVGNSGSLEQLNTWLNDWTVNNPAYMGVNWKCGQEASVRVMHLALAAIILEQTSNTSNVLLSFIRAHLKRISPTIMYAVAQDNNHGTSEAAALFIGGSWLANNGDKQGENWSQQGRKWLENRAKRLIESDGSFSQYSVTYHRVMLDTYCLVEVWRRKHNLQLFSPKLYNKLSAASMWLYYFTNINTGDAPNLGANDGARLIPLTNTDYRDFRPSVQLANSIFNNALAYKEQGEYDLPIEWLRIERPMAELPLKTSTDFTRGGYCFLKQGDIEVYLNYPQFKFRPSQCDALHLDLWIHGVNIIRDGGTYSYNAGSNYIDYYGGTESHSTVQFDNHEQMPRLSRFLLGDWLKAIEKEVLVKQAGLQSLSVGYKDRFNCKHVRSLKLTEKKLIISDNVSGFKTKAISRLRLASLDWVLEGNKLTSSVCTIIFNADVSIKRAELTSGKESRYYYQESDLPVLEIEIQCAGTITTEIIF
ncbi:heparinase II/III-family protein [Pseudoalteromonas fenneropenaei]|uniref:Heparinase II/III-family protein n=1 Tax=Pseudoalteromonas fenneropenaei TaxID=1737459 RepID=A0ABV7CKM6_9GAMM